MAGRRVLHVVSEAVPWVKTGGLADVAGALPAAQRALGLDVRIVLPGYPQVMARLREAGPLVAAAPAFGPVFGAAAVRLFWAAPDAQGTPTVLVIDSPWHYGREGGLYGTPDGTEWADNPRRFALLGWVAAQMALGGLVPDWVPQVVHAHDWHAALAPVYIGAHPAGRSVCTVLSLHNMAFAGICSPDWLPELGLPFSRFHPADLEYHGQFSFLKAGLVAARALTTVSPTYAREILTAPGGCGMEGVLSQRAAVLEGILNGIDTEQWDPMQDPSLSVPFDANRLPERAANRRALLAELEWPQDADGVLFALISRISEQKGIDLLLDALPRLMDLPWRLVVLGDGDPALKARLAEMARVLPDRIRLCSGFNEPLAHRLFGGADAVLVPSRFEPCGLTQMYGHRYGSVPLVRHTGGLADTVREGPWPVADPAMAGDGFVFHQTEPGAMADAMRRLCVAFADRPRWQQIQRNGMARRSDWSESASRYNALYERFSR